MLRNGFAILSLVISAGIWAGSCTRDRKINDSQCKAVGEVFDPTQKKCVKSQDSTNVCKSPQVTHPAGTGCTDLVSAQNYCRTQGTLRDYLDSGSCGCTGNSLPHPAQSNSCATAAEYEQYCRSLTPPETFDGRGCVKNTQNLGNSTNLCSTGDVPNPDIAATNRTSKDCVTLGRARDICLAKSQVFDETTFACVAQTTTPNPTNPTTPTNPNPTNPTTPTNPTPTNPNPTNPNPSTPDNSTDRFTDAKGKSCLKTNVINPGTGSADICCPQILEVVKLPTVATFTSAVTTCSQAKINAPGEKICIVNTPVLKSGSGQEAILAVEFHLIPKTDTNKGCSYPGELRVGDFKEIIDTSPAPTIQQR